MGVALGALLNCQQDIFQLLVNREEVNAQSVGGDPTSFFFDQGTQQTQAAMMRQVHNVTSNWHTATIANPEWASTGLQANIRVLRLCYALSMVIWHMLVQPRAIRGLAFPSSVIMIPLYLEVMGFNSFHTYASNFRTWSPVNFTQVLQVGAGHHIRSFC